MTPPNPHISYNFFAETEPATTPPDRKLTIKIKRLNTNQTEIEFGISCLTTANGHLTDSTSDLMEYMLTYHEINIEASTRFIDITSHKVSDIISSLTNYEGTHLRIILYLKDFNPQATHRLDVDVATIDLRNAMRQPTREEENEMCTICLDNFNGTEVVNSLQLQCNHTYHHQCIVEWIRNNLSCPTCRQTNF
ncbi:hypothetical protein N665_1151s0007 [Sinapis alba]|nr:hypothetical protein N665_1151s0007 [Sinapis alba]